MRQDQDGLNRPKGGYLSQQNRSPSRQKLRRLILIAVLLLTSLACGFIELNSRTPPKRITFQGRLPTLTPTSANAPLTAGDGVEPLGGGPAKGSTPYAPDATVGSITASSITTPSNPAPTATATPAPSQATVASMANATPTFPAEVAVPATVAPVAQVVSMPALPALAPRSITAGWTVAGIQLFADPASNNLLFYADLENQTGSAQRLSLISGVFYDEGGQLIAASDQVDGYWPIEAMPANGRMPFELTVAGIQSAASFNLEIGAEPVSDAPRQDFELIGLNQRPEAERYCLAGQLRNPGEALQEYLIIVTILYNPEGGIINFSHYSEPGFAEIAGDHSLDFDICIGSSHREIAGHELRAWGR